MWNILANDGMAENGIKALEDLGHKVDTNKIPQEELADRINDYDVIVVRSATKVRADLIKQMKRTKLVIRAGVGLDNIDLEAAKDKGIHVENTPSASSRSVAELAFGHMMNMARFIHEGNRSMPAVGGSAFKSLKKAYSKGIEVEGKTLGIIGFGRIGKELAKIALGAGMTVLAHDPWTEDNSVELNIIDQKLIINVPLVEKAEILKRSDFISVHTPKLDEPTIGRLEMEKCKKGVFLLNTSRGGVINEDDLIWGLENGQVGAAALDVFEGEPSPREEILKHDKISLSPHIGASTKEAQNKIGEVITDLVKSYHSRYEG